LIFPAGTQPCEETATSKVKFAGETPALFAILGEFVAQEADEIAMIGEDVRFGRGGGVCAAIGRRIRGIEFILLRV
jgi:hypothetical protein